MIIFERVYDGEGLCDVDRDVVECFCPGFNPLVENIPQDKFGFQCGTFKVTIEWEPEDENNR